MATPECRKCLLIAWRLAGWGCQILCQIREPGDPALVEGAQRFEKPMHRSRARRVRGGYRELRNGYAVSIRNRGKSSIVHPGFPLFPRNNTTMCDAQLLCKGNKLPALREAPGTQVGSGGKLLGHAVSMSPKPFQNTNHMSTKALDRNVIFDDIADPGAEQWLAGRANGTSCAGLGRLIAVRALPRWVLPPFNLASSKNWNPIGSDRAVAPQNPNTFRSKSVKRKNREMIQASINCNYIDRQNPERWSFMKARAGLSVARGGAICALLLATACAQPTSRQTVGDFRGSLAQGQFAQAADIATRQANPTPEGQPRELLWALNAGAARLHAAEYRPAVTMLDGAEEMMRASEQASFNWGSTYRFGSYDAVMLNTYKALAMLGMGDTANARVEVNRLDERQRRVTERFQREISEAEQRVSTQSGQGTNAGALSAARQTPEYQEQMRELERWGHYAPFVNPAATYLHGIFFLNSALQDAGSVNQGDVSRSIESFQRVVGMTGGNPVATADLALANEAARGRRPAPQVWVVFENGQSPVFEQQNITLPMPVAARGGGVTVRPVTVSLPRMRAQPSAYPSLEVRADQARAATQSVGSIEAVMASEFRQRYPSLVAGAVFEAVAKAALISGANAVGGRVGGVGGLLLDVSATAAANVTVADTRSWHALPREFQAARLAVPASGRIEIRGPGGSQSVTLPAGRSSIVLVKAQVPGSPLVAQVIPL